MSETQDKIDWFATKLNDETKKTVGMKEALMEIEQLTLVVNDAERLRREVRMVATEAIKKWVLGV